MKTFFRRLFSTVILLALFALILVGPEKYANFTFNILASVFAVISVFEFGMILKKSGNAFNLKSTMLFTTLTVISAAVLTAKFVLVFALFFVIYAWTRFLVSKNDPFKMRAIFASAAAYFMISIPFCTIVEVYQMNDSYNMIFLYLLLVTKIGDIAAYVTGSLSGYFLRNHGGNHKMIPSISPGKSYEGAVGGFIFTLLLSYFLWPFCGIECTVFNPFWASMILGVLLFFGCMAGDLSESAFKRTCKIKDSGAILPGIGGMLDLVDSLMVTGPLFFLFLLIFTDFKI